MNLWLDLGARRARRVLVLSAFAVAASSFWAAAPAQAATQTFNYTGLEQTFVVPAGVFSIQVVAIGGSGGDATDASGGVGARVVGNVSVTPGQTLYVEVGGKGESQAEGGEGGFNGGGDGAGGGGGASDVRTSPLGAGLAPDTRLIVAGAGGGGGASGENPGTDGGAAGSPGVAGEYAGGGAGTQTEGGAGASGFSDTAGSGVLGSGGKAGFGGVATGPGGGGGGGYYGGGGGAGAGFVGSTGGGGGSSLVPPGGTLELAGPADAPKVELTYNPPAPPAPSPVANAVLGAHPKKLIRTKKKRVKVKFSFTSDIAGATFECKLDRGPFAPCTSPKSYRVKLGSHTFSVRAKGAGGTDPTPATFRFKVKKKR